MNKYELLYIVGTQYTDPEVAEIQTKIAALLEKTGAQILRNENLGKIRLAYAINKTRHGSYILVHFDADPSTIQAMNRQLELTDEVVRHTILSRAPGAEQKKVELISYVAPLSEEGKRPENKPAPYREKSVVHTRAVEEVPLQAPVVAEKTMTIEELDKKLDEILEDDLSEKV
jgi:small subunit ribosomal protein S6